jgi:hypothetical protein
MKKFLFLILVLIFFSMYFSMYHLLVFAQIQQLAIAPQPISCTPLTIMEVLRGQPVPSGLLSRCLLTFTKQILTLLYTLSLLISTGFIIYSGFLFAIKPGDDKAKSFLVWAIIGALVTILAFSLVKGIEFSLTRF